MELLGQKVFNMVGIKSADYYYVQEKGCLLSRDLNTDNRMFNCYDLSIMSANTMNQVMSGLDRLSIKDGYKVDKVKLQVEIMHFIDILFSNIDRHLNNYGVYIKDGVGTLCVFDNGLLLEYFDCITKPQSCITDKMFFCKIVEFEHFLKKLPLKLRLQLYKVYLMFTPSFVSELVNSVEKESIIKLNSKKSTLMKYYKNYLLIGMVINKYIDYSDRKEIVKLYK